MNPLAGLKMPFYFGLFYPVFFKGGSVHQRKDASCVAFTEKVSFTQGHSKTFRLTFADHRLLHWPLQVVPPLSNFCSHIQVPFHLIYKLYKASISF